MMITIFTATYNREKYLPKLYRSLLAQDDLDFEWLIVDDGSSNKTEELIKRYIKENKLNITFIKQKHGGKHRAINTGLDLAKGKYFFMVDSDDYLLDGAISTAKKWLKEIDADENFAGVSGEMVELKNLDKIKDTDKYIDATDFEREKYNLIGDHAEIYRTDLLKKFKFPEFEDENFVTEDVMFQEIAALGKKLRWHKKTIYVCNYLETGLTKTGANELSGKMNNFKGYSYWVKRALEVKPFSQRYGMFNDYLKVCKEKHLSTKEKATGLKKNTISFIFYTIFTYPLTFFSRALYKVTRIFHK